jgi:hypothetical protein
MTILEPRPSKVIVPRAVVRKTEEHLQLSARAQTEIVVLWSGIIRGRTTRVCRVWLPRQVVDVGFFAIPGDELFALNKEIYELGERLVAQVHTHPTLAFHSDADSEYAVTSTEGGLSIVVPQFGRVGIEATKDCAYFLFRYGRWRALSESEIRALMRFERD